MSMCIRASSNTVNTRSVQKAQKGREAIYYSVCGNIALHRFHGLHGIINGFPTFLRLLHASPYTNKLLRVHGAYNNLRDVLDFQFILSFNAFNAIFKHGNAEGAGGGHNFGLRFESFVDTLLVDACTDLFLHPCASTTTTAAEALITVAVHLRNAIAIEDRKDTPGFIIHVVV